MLNGIDPILIFQFFKTTDKFENLVAAIPKKIGTETHLTLPPIPIYLSEKLTGLYIDSESKQIDVETKTETLANGLTPEVNQKAIVSTVKVEMKATKESIGLTLLSAVADLILPKVTSKEYSITYLHGATTVFDGLLHSFSVVPNSDNTLLLVTLEIAKTSESTKKPAGVPEVRPSGEAVGLDSGMVEPTTVAPTAPLKTPLQGPAPVAPSGSPPITLG
jgi:hypothetical protein